MKCIYEIVLVGLLSFSLGGVVASIFCMKESNNANKEHILRMER